MILVGTKPIAVQVVRCSRFWYILRVETRGFSEKLYVRREREDYCNVLCVCVCVRALTSVKKLSSEIVKTTSGTGLWEKVIFGCCHLGNGH